MVAAFLFGSIAPCLASASPDDTGVLQFEPCMHHSMAGKLTRKVECASLEVPENYDDSQGRTLSLFVVRLPALTSRPQPDPLIMIAGGPGQASTEAFLYADHILGKVHLDRDILLLDQRGTGRSGALQCDMLDAESLDEDYDRRQYQMLVRNCLSNLSERADLRQYTTSVAIRDLESLRESLKLDAWNLYGVSYGTRVVQHYMRRYPDAVRLAILDGVVPADLHLGPTIAMDSQRALDAMILRCAENAACAEAFPELEAGIVSLLDQLAANPVTVSYESFTSGRMESMRFGVSHLAILIRFALYQDEMMALLPAMLHEAYANDNFSALARQIQNTTEALQGMSFGMHNSVVCSEDVPFYDEAERDMSAQDETYIGEILFDSLLATCELWPEGVVDEAFKTPVRFDGPVLLLSGSEDPITPPAFAEQVAAALTQATHVTAPGQGHGVFSIGCIPTLIAQAISDADVTQLNTGCVSSLSSAPFFLDFNGPAP